MFYSHEILTSRKYGVATVWLVATLGAKSSTKKVNKKAILEVNVRKACETIIQPEAPMALRLQSNLLYGISRVYDQQCGYVLSDVQAAQMKMRDLLKIVKNNDLDPSAANSHPEQLILLDDPAFLPDMSLPVLDFSLFNIELDQSGNSQRSSQSMMSIRRRSSSVSSLDARSVVGINLPSSSNHAGSYQLPLNDPFGGSSAQKPFGGKGRNLFDDEEGNLYQDDVIFEFDADGEMRDIDINEREARRLGSIYPAGEGRLQSDSEASGRVRKEHEGAVTGRLRPILDGEGDFDMINFGDDDMKMFPDAEAFPLMSGALRVNDRPNRLLESDDKVFSEESSFDSGAASAKRRQHRTRKTLAKDQAIQLHKNELAMWQREYLDHMVVATIATIHKKEAAQAKKNADHFIYGTGLNGVGEGIGYSKVSSPLAMFSGASLLAKIAGKSAPEAKTNGKKGTKRAAGEDKEQPSPSKRARQEPGFEDEIGRGNFDNGGMIMMEDSNHDVEVGREAPSALADYHSSAMMPWNVSASLHSHQRGASSSIQGGRLVSGSIGRRFTSASPLIGRGSNIPGELEHFSSQLEDNVIMYGRSDSGVEEDNGTDTVPRRGTSQGLGMSSSQAEFEIFGPAAQVDTQMAGSSQWVKDALDRESGNFFEYVKNTISEKVGDELGDDDLDVDQLVGGEEDHEKFVTFEELFDPSANTCMVAAQAFYHVLSLATKGRVWVEQDIDEDFMEPFGEIRIGVTVAAAAV